MFSYRTLLKQAWNIAWKNKYLWFFGLFASLVASSGSIEYQVLTSSINHSIIEGSYVSLGSLLYLGDLCNNLWLGLQVLFTQNIWTIINAITLIIVTLALLASFVWLAITSQVGLIDSVKKLIKSKKKSQTLNIREGLTLGNHHFWPVLGLNVLIKILISATFFLISFPLLLMFISNANVLTIIYTILFVIFMPVAVSLALMVKYAIAYKVLQNKSFVLSLEKGWKLFRKNWLISLETAITLFLVNFLFGVSALLIISFIIFPLFLLGIIFQFAWLTTLTLLLGLLVVVLVGSLATTFQTTAWTDLFLHLDGKGGLAKLERIFRKK